MQNLTGKTTGATLTATEWNQLPQEVQNVITQNGLALSSGDLNQLGKGISAYVANGTFYNDSGSADTYVLSGLGTKQDPPAYTDGMTVQFIAANANTGASTVNVAGLGVKNIVEFGGAALAAGRIITTRVTKIKFDNGNDRFFIENVDIADLGVNSTTDELNELDASAAAITNYVSGVRTYIHEDGSDSNQFDISGNVTENTFESIGPTGSGATNIWTALDAMPSDAKAVILNVRLVNTPSAVDTRPTTTFKGRQTGSVALGGESTLAENNFVVDDHLATADVKHPGVIVALDASGRFDATWGATGDSSRLIEAFLAGFIV